MVTNYKFTYTINGVTQSFKLSATPIGDSIYVNFDEDFFKQNRSMRRYNIQKQMWKLFKGHHFCFDGIGDWKTQTAEWREGYLYEVVPTLLDKVGEDWVIDSNNGWVDSTHYRLKHPNDKFIVEELTK